MKTANRIYLLILTMIGVSYNTYCFSIGNPQDTTEHYYTKQLKQISNDLEKAQLYLEQGNHYANLNKEELAFSAYKKALSLFQKTKNMQGEMDVNYQLFNLLHGQNKLDIDPLPYLQHYYSYAEQLNDKNKMLKAKMSYAQYYFNSDYTTSKAYYLDAEELASNIGDTTQLGRIYTNLGLLYSNYVGQDSARIYFDNALKSYKNDMDYERFIAYLNYANSFQKEERFNEAIHYLKLAETITPNKHRLNLQKVLFGKFSNCYQSIGNYRDAFDYYNKYNEIRDSINLTSQNIEISKIKEQYDNEKLRAENAESETRRLESEAKRIQNRNLLYGSFGLLLFVGFTGFLIQKNARKKQLIAEQERALESQKLATVLKEQELIAIDAMIEGQEKERQRIANDLHDDLGSLMTTVKWQFNSLKENHSQAIYEKTDHLLEEAYQKIRSIAHAKNSGVIANEGLLKAVHNMAEKVSQSNKISIQVIDHGLNERLENSLELTIFRIIQELIANIIKHSNATEAAIHITNHENSLNILVEDDGKGFNSKQVTKNNKGMGISSIDKRVEHLNGTMVIESEHGKGTTIIIDIPL